MWKESYHNLFIPMWLCVCMRVLHWRKNGDGPKSMDQHFYKLLLLCVCLFFCSMAHTKALNRFQAVCRCEHKVNIKYHVYNADNDDIWNQQPNWRDEYWGGKKRVKSVLCAIVYKYKTSTQPTFFFLLHSKLTDLRLTGLSKIVSALFFFSILSLLSQSHWSFVIVSRFIYLRQLFRLLLLVHSFCLLFHSNT